MKGLVREGKAHAALVFEGGEAVAWCEFGSPAELPNIYHRKEYDAGLTQAPDFTASPASSSAAATVARESRRSPCAVPSISSPRPVASGRGLPHDLQGQKTSASFLYNGTRSLFEQAGFTYERPKGQKNCVMRRVVAPANREQRGLAVGR